MKKSLKILTSLALSATVLLNAPAVLAQEVAESTPNESAVLESQTPVETTPVVNPANPEHVFATKQAAIDYGNSVLAAQEEIVYSSFYVISVDGGYIVSMGSGEEPKPTEPTEPEDPTEGEETPEEPTEGEENPEDPAEGEENPEDPAEGEENPEDPAEGEENPEDPAEGEENPEELPSRYFPGAVGKVTSDNPVIEGIASTNSTVLATLPDGSKHEIKVDNNGAWTFELPEGVSLADGEKILFVFQGEEGLEALQSTVGGDAIYVTPNGEGEGQITVDENGNIVENPEENFPLPEDRFAFYTADEGRAFAEAVKEANETIVRHQLVRITDAKGNVYYEVRFFDEADNQVDIADVVVPEVPVDPEKPTDPTDPETPVDPEKPTEEKPAEEKPTEGEEGTEEKPANTDKETSTESKNQATLPETGEAENKLTLFGSLVMILGSALLFLNKKRNTSEQ